MASWVLPRIAIDPNEKAWTPDVKLLEVEAKLAGETDWAKYFKQQGQGFLPSSPKPANLRLVRLPSQHLPRAQLEYAKLEGAYLSQAQLQAANLENAQLQAADLWGAQLQAADLWLAQLQAANLENAQLQAADLEDAQLQAANLENAQLQATNLKNAELQAALFMDTALFGASPPATSAVYLGKPSFNDDPVWKSAVFLGKPPFDYKAPDWKSLEKLGLGMTEGKHRDEVLERIKQAKDHGYDPSTQTAFIHDPGVVYRELLTTICAWNKWDYGLESRREAVRGIHRNYWGWYSRTRNDPYVEGTLTEIDRTLCQNPACADLKDDIDGLDCSQFKDQPQFTESKAINSKK